MTEGLLEGIDFGPQLVDARQGGIGLSQGGIVQHRPIAFDKVVAERHVVDEIEVASGQAFLAVEEGTDGHALEVVESRTVFHRVVHRKAIGRVEQSGMQGEIGQIVHPLIVAAHIVQVQIGVIVGDSKKPVQQTVGVLECHGVEGGHTPRRSSRGLCRFDHGVPIFVVELVLHAARHAHIVTLQHGEERNARIGRHGQ